MANTKIEWATTVWNPVSGCTKVSDDDCLKEGIKVYSPCSECGAEIYVIWGIDEGECFDTPGEAYAALIDRISGKGTWDSNPWVFVYSFQLLK